MIKNTTQALKLIAEVKKHKNELTEGQMATFIDAMKAIQEEREVSGKDAIEWLQELSNKIPETKAGKAIESYLKKTS